MHHYILEGFRLSNKYSCYLKFLISLCAFVLLLSSISNGDVCNNYTFETGFGIGWDLSYNKSAILNKEESHSGIQSMKLLPPQDKNTPSSASIQVKGPALIKFWWKRDFDSSTNLAIYDDKNTIYLLHDPKILKNNWGKETVEVYDADDHIIEWGYSIKNGYDSCNQLAASWIDDITICTSNPQEGLANGDDDNNAKNFIIINSSLPYDLPELHRWKSIETGLEDAHNSKISSILINNGKYYINKTIIINEEVTLDGESSLGVLLYPSPNVNAEIDAFYISANNCTVKNISFFGFGVALSVTGSNITICNNKFNSTLAGLKIVNTKEINIYNNCLNEALSNGGNIFVTNSDEINISNNTLFGRYGIGLMQSRNIIISGNNYKLSSSFIKSDAESSFDEFENIQDYSLEYNKCC